MSGIDGIIGGHALDNVNVATEAVLPELDAKRFVPNPLNLPLHNLALRPGSHRRVSFRATPGSVVTVSLRGHEWLSLDVLNASRVGASETGGTSPPTPGSGPSTATGAMAAVAFGTTAAVTTAAPGVSNPTAATPVNAGGAAFALGTTGAGAPGQAEMLANLHAVMTKPVGPFGPIGPGGVFDPPDLIDPVDPPPQPTLPVDVVVSVRDGTELGRSTLLADPNSPSPARVKFDRINGNDVIDVTFVNPNDVAVICSSCTVNVARKVRTSVTTMRNEMFLRAFNGAIRSLSPEITVADGSVRVALHGDLAHELGLTSITKDVPESFTGGATFEATDIEIMGQGELVRSVIKLLQSHIGRKLISTANNNTERARLVSRKKSHVEPDTFIDEVATAYFDEQVQVTDTVIDLVTPSNRPSKAFKKRLRDAVKGWLADYPMLIDSLPHRPADLAFSASYALTGIHGDWGPISLEVDEIRVSLYLALNQVTRQLEAPFGDLPLDRLTVGSIRPSVHMDLDISDFDIDIEVPWYLGLPSFGILPLGAFLLEQGLEELADFLAGKAEQLVPRAVHGAVAAHTIEYGELVATTLASIANRDQKFHRAAANREQIAIATIDTNQLRVPHDPRKGQRPSPIKGIDEQAPVVRPIDHDPFSAVASGPSPEHLLQRINHFVFVMMENRSFDHMLGHLSHPDHGGRSDVDGLDGSDRPLGGDLTGTRATPLEGPNPSFWPNLPHDHASIVRQINDGQMNGFASEYARKLARVDGVNQRGFLNDPERVLRYQTPNIVNTYDRLAREYTICDRWFASVPAGTYPNRACYYSGVTPSLTNQGIVEEFGYLSDLTVFDLLNHANIDWKVFESDISFLRVFNNFRIEQDRIRPISELKDRFRPVSKPTDPLKSVTFIDPNFTGFPSAQGNNDDQPPTDVRAGQDFIAGIVELIEQSANWESTMLVITYDEHGGFADHVPPPGAPGSSHPPGGPTAISLSHPDAHTYGVRVPTFIVSPLVQRGGVAHQIFDHAAVFRTLLERFAPEHVNSKIIPERVRRSRHLGEVMSNQPPRVAPAAAKKPQTLAAQAPSRRARLTFDEGIDQEDAVWVLNQIGIPSSR